MCEYICVCIYVYIWICICIYITWDITNYGRFINWFLLNIIRSTWQFERINKKYLDKKCLLCSMKHVSMNKCSQNILIYTYTHIHTYIHTYAHIYTYRYIEKHIRTYINIYIYIYIYIHIYIYIYIHEDH